MSERFTRNDAQIAFEVLCNTMGKRMATAYNDVGAWELDHNSAYGGYVVEEIVSHHGAVRNPLGARRRNAREFCSAVYFAVYALIADRVSLDAIAHEPARRPPA